MNDSLKKLFIHSMLQIDPEEKEPPMTLKEEKDILNRFSDTDLSDSMNFTLVKEREESGKLFSKNALERFLHTLRLYVGGRIMGHFNKTARSPEVLVVRIEVEHITKEEYKKRFSSISEL